MSEAPPPRSSSSPSAGQMPVRPRTLRLPTPCGTRSRRPAGWSGTPRRVHPRPAKPPYEVLARSPTCPTAARTRPAAGDGQHPGRGLAGGPADLRRGAGRPPARGVVVEALDLGNVDGAGDVLHELATAHPGRVRGAARRAAGRLGTGPRVPPCSVRRRHHPRLARPVDGARGGRGARSCAAFDDLRRSPGRLARRQRRPGRRVAVVRRRRVRARSTRSCATCSPSAAAPGWRSAARTPSAGSTATPTWSSA